MRRLVARLLFLPTLAFNALLGRWLRIRNWWDRVDEHVIVGALPMRSDVKRLYDEGVRAVVNTCEEYEGPVQQYEEYKITQLRVPTVDFTHPSLESVKRSVAFIQEHVQNGETVYIHCKAGRARSATMALCWLVAHKGLTPDDAQERLLEKRPHVNPRLTQREVVQEFCRAVDR